MKNLNKKYIKIINSYCNKFAKKYEIDFDGWVGNRVGEIAYFADYFFDFLEIKFCIDNNISFDYLNDWYYYVIEFYPKANCNLENYCKLRRDFEIRKGFLFNLNDFEKYLLNLMISDNSLKE